MKRTLLVMVATIVAFLSSCVTADVEEQSLAIGSENFKAVINSTRTYLDGAAVVWNENDLLTIFTKTSHNRQYKIKSLADNGRTATFGYVSFTGSDNTTITENYAVYPYNADATLSNGVITTALNSTQAYSSNDKNIEYALMVAKSSDNNLSFDNAGALIRFNISKIVPDLFTLNSIRLSSASNKIAGEVTIDLSANGTRAVVTENGVNTITLSNINAEITTDVQSFYVAMPAMEFADKDLTVTFVCAEGSKEFQLPAFELEQGMIKTIAYSISEAENFVGTTPSSAPASNEIWYTNGSTTEPTTLSIYAADFGENMLSNTYDADKGCWVIKFDDTITRIGAWAFMDSSLTSITIPNSITNIETMAFFNCLYLASITIPDSVTSIGRMAFVNCPYIASIIIPDSVTEIGEAAFSACNSLTVFYGKFTSIDNLCLIVDGELNSFAIGSGVTGYTIPDSVTSIGAYAFTSCTSLTSITIPDGVTSIGTNAFSDCTSLTSVYCKPAMPPSVEGDMSTGDANIYVPTASVEAYKAADGWKEYADKIVGYDF